MPSSPEAKSKVRQRHESGIREFQKWLNRQKQEPTHEYKIEMFDFFLDEAAKKR